MALHDTNTFTVNPFDDNTLDIDSEQCIIEQLGLNDDVSASHFSDIKTSYFTPALQFSPKDDTEFTRLFFETYTLLNYKSALARKQKTHSNTSTSLTDKLLSFFKPKRDAVYLRPLMRKGVVKPKFITFLYQAFSTKESARAFLHDALRLEVAQGLKGQSLSREAANKYSNVTQSTVGLFTLSIYEDYRRYIQLLSALTRDTITDEGQKELEKLEQRLLARLGFQSDNVAKIRQETLDIIHAKKRLTDLDDVLYCIYHSRFYPFRELNDSFLPSNEACSKVNPTTLETRIAEVLEYATEALSEVCLLKRLTTVFNTTKMLQEFQNGGRSAIIERLKTLGTIPIEDSTQGFCELERMCIEDGSCAFVGKPYPNTIKKLFRRFSRTYHQSLVIPEGLEYVTKFFDFATDGNGMPTYNQAALQFAIGFIDLIPYDKLMEIFINLDDSAAQKDINTLLFSEEVAGVENFWERVVERMIQFHKIIADKLDNSPTFSQITYLRLRAHKYTQSYMQMLDKTQSGHDIHNAAPITFSAPFTQVLRNEVMNVVPKLQRLLDADTGDKQLLMEIVLNTFDSTRQLQYANGHGHAWTNRHRLTDIIHLGLFIPSFFSGDDYWDNLGNMAVTSVQSVPDAFLDKISSFNILNSKRGDFLLGRLTSSSPSIPVNAITHHADEVEKRVFLRNTLYGAALFSLLPLLTTQETNLISDKAIKSIQLVLDSVLQATEADDDDAELTALIDDSYYVVGVLPVLHASKTKTYQKFSQEHIELTIAAVNPDNHESTQSRGLALSLKSTVTHYPDESSILHKFQIHEAPEDIQQKLSHTDGDVLPYYPTLFVPTKDIVALNGFMMIDPITRRIAWKAQVLNSPGYLQSNLYSDNIDAHFYTTDVFEDIRASINTQPKSHPTH